MAKQALSVPRPGQVQIGNGPAAQAVDVSSAINVLSRFQSQLQQAGTAQAVEQAKEKGAAEGLSMQQAGGGIPLKSSNAVGRAFNAAARATWLAGAENDVTDLVTQVQQDYDKNPGGKTLAEYKQLIMGGVEAILDPLDEASRALVAPSLEATAKKGYQSLVAAEINRQKKFQMEEHAAAIDNQTAESRQAVQDGNPDALAAKVQHFRATLEEMAKSGYYSEAQIQDYQRKYAQSIYAQAVTEEFRKSGFDPKYFVEFLGKGKVPEDFAKATGPELLKMVNDPRMREAAISLMQQEWTAHLQAKERQRTASTKAKELMRKEQEKGLSIGIYTGQITSREDIIAYSQDSALEAEDIDQAFARLDAYEANAQRVRPDRVSRMQTFNAAMSGGLTVDELNRRYEASMETGVGIDEAAYQEAYRLIQAQQEQEENKDYARARDLLAMAARVDPSTGGLTIPGLDTNKADERSQVAFSAFQAFYDAATDPDRTAGYMEIAEDIIKRYDLRNFKREETLPTVEYPNLYQLQKPIDDIPGSITMGEREVLQKVRTGLLSEADADRILLGWRRRREMEASGATPTPQSKDLDLEQATEELR